MTVLIVTAAAVWAASVVPSYLLLRGDFRSAFGCWTVADRRVAVFVAVFGGPAAIIFIGVPWLLGRSADKPAAW